MKANKQMSLSLATVGGVLLCLSVGAAQARPVRHPVVTHPLAATAPAIERDGGPQSAAVLQETHPAPESGSPLGTPGNGSPSNTEADRD